MIRVALVGEYDKCKSVRDALSSKDETRASIQLNINSVLLPSALCISPQARVQRFKFIIERIDNKTLGPVFMLGPVNSKAEADFLRQAGFIIWHLNISKEVSIQRGDLLVGEWIKSPVAYSPIEAISAMRAQAYALARNNKMVITP